MRAWAIIAGMLAIVLSMGVSAKIYKWVDEDGQIHYGQQPPNGAGAESMSVDSAPPSASSGNGASAGSASGDDAGQSGSDDKEAAGNDDAVAQNCKVARQNLSVLETAGPDGRFRQPDGEVKHYNEEQWQAKVDQNRKYIDNFCEQQ